MLVRTLISEGRIVHQTTVEDPNSPTGRRVERIVREGPIALITTTTGELYSENETRMLSWHIHEDREQTAAVMTGIAERAIGAVGASIDLAAGMTFSVGSRSVRTMQSFPLLSRLQMQSSHSWCAFGAMLARSLPSSKHSALLHQAQRQNRRTRSSGGDRR